MKKTRRDFMEAMIKAGWQPIYDEPKLFDDDHEPVKWRYRTGGEVIWDHPAWLNWDGGEVMEIPF